MSHEDDIFSALHTVEEDAVQHGYDEGVQEGLVAGLVEGRQLGVQKGFELGDELGFYMGCVRAWRWQQQHQQQADPSESKESKETAAVPQRAERGLVALEDMLNSFPILDSKVWEIFCYIRFQ